ncbi:MAG: hypothetical protein ACOH5I_24610 [Oligoflexus sp.]
MKLFIGILCSIFLSSCATTIRGYVIQEDGQSIAARGGKVNVSFLDGANPPQVLDLQEDGSFVTDDEIFEGHYLIEPLIPGYSTNSLRVYVDESKTVRIVAKPLDPNPSKSIQIQRENRLDRGSGTARLAPLQL